MGYTVSFTITVYLSRFEITWKRFAITWSITWSIITWSTHYKVAKILILIILLADGLFFGHLSLMIKTWTERRRNSSTYNEQEFIKKSWKIQIRLNFEKNSILQFSSLKCHGRKSLKSQLGWIPRNFPFEIFKPKMPFLKENHVNVITVIFKKSWNISQFTLHMIFIIFSQNGDFETYLVIFKKKKWRENQMYRFFSTKTTHL